MDHPIFLVQLSLQYPNHLHQYQTIHLNRLEQTIGRGIRFCSHGDLEEEQKNVLFNEGTERPFTSSLLQENRDGFYHCANCDAKLFSSNSKYDSGTGWPSFNEALPGAFNTKVDYSFGMKRTEYHCAKCGAHHGHVFEDGPGKDGKRFCNNGLCLIFKPTN